ncbi:hypothetical protein HMI54_015624 [Coelomomyces lativittatus]|nr:hypothetical protein HMI54_015624 [Coelomomyces lativittatus]
MTGYKGSIPESLHFSKLRNTMRWWWVYVFIVGWSFLNLGSSSSSSPITSSLETNPTISLQKEAQHAQWVQRQRLRALLLTFWFIGDLGVRQTKEFLLNPTSLECF